MADLTHRNILKDQSPTESTHTSTIITQDDRIIQCQLAQIHRDLGRQPPLLRQLAQRARRGDLLRDLLQLPRLRVESLQVLLHYARLQRGEESLRVAERAAAAATAAAHVLLLAVLPLLLRLLLAAVLLLLLARWRSRRRRVSASVSSLLRLLAVPGQPARVGDGIQFEEIEGRPPSIRCIEKGHMGISMPRC